MENKLRIKLRQMIREEMLKEAVEMKVTKISAISGLQKLVDDGKVTYRGMGLGNKSSKFWDIAGEGGVSIQVNGKEYHITDTEFNKLGGIKKIRFKAPFRRS